MRCRRHIADHTSSVGVCATCLRHRLSAILAAQAQLEQSQPQPQYEPPSETHSLPQSVSPYVSCRNSDATWKQNVLFYSTPQVVPPTVTVEVKKTKRTGRGKFSDLILGLFRSKSVKPDPNPVDHPVEVCPGGPCARAGGRSRPGHSRNGSGFAFSLSPMVRPSPKTAANGEIRVQAKPRCSTAAFCKNRSRKLADFGRYNF